MYAPPSDVAHDKSKQGELPLEEVTTMLKADDVAPETAKLVVDWLERPSGVLGMLMGCGGDLAGAVHYYQAITIKAS